MGRYLSSSSDERELLTIDANDKFSDPNFDEIIMGTSGGTESSSQNYGKSRASLLLET